MSQEQKTVPLILKAGETKQAAATGNNAAWMCPCGRALPLIGRSGLMKGTSENMSVKCPSCKRRYFVMPDGKDQGVTLEVRET
jgi:DNA-directed RNA polymerase subunit RPC12/RpoP